MSSLPCRINPDDPRAPPQEDSPAHALLERAVTAAHISEVLDGLSQ